MAQEYLISRMGQGRYAIELEAVQEVMAAVPGQDRGAGWQQVPFNGGWLPVLDLHRVLWGESGPDQLSNRIVVLGSKTKGLRRWGLRAPGATQVESLEFVACSQDAPPCVIGVSEDAQGPVWHLDLQALARKLKACFDTKRRVAQG